MSTLSSSATLPIGETATATESVALTVLPIAGAGEGRGRLVHPTLGTYDYEQAPDEWDGLSSDVVISPRWIVTAGIFGSVVKLEDGDISDAVCEERWTSPAALGADQWAMLLAMFTAPPDPGAGEFVEWWPSYETNLGFYVALVGLRAGANAITMTPTRQDIDEIEGPVALTLQVLARIE